MGTFRYLCSALLLVAATHSSALALTDKQKTQLKQARQSMGLADGEMLKRHICLWDLSGRSGPIYNGATNLRIYLLRYNIDISLEAFTNEGVLVASLKNGHCDAALMSGFRARHFNRFTSSIDALGALPTLEHVNVLLRTLAHPQLIAHADHSPPAFSVLIREIATDSFQAVQSTLKKETQRIPSHWSVSRHEDEKQGYNSLMRDARIKLRDSQYYDPTMLNTMKRIRCSLEAGRPECSQSIE